MKSNLWLRPTLPTLHHLRATSSCVFVHLGRRRSVDSDSPPKWKSASSRRSISSRAPGSGSVWGRVGRRGGGRRGGGRSVRPRSRTRPPRPDRRPTGRRGPRSGGAGGAETRRRGGGGRAAGTTGTPCWPSPLRSRRRPARRVERDGVGRVAGVVQDAARPRRRWTGRTSSRRQAPRSCSSPSSRSSRVSVQSDRPRKARPEYRPRAVVRCAVEHRVDVRRQRRVPVDGVGVVVDEPRG